MKKEIRVDFEELKNPQSITPKNIVMMKQLGLDVQRDELDIEDDPDLKQRIYHARTRKTTVFMGK